MKNIWRFLSDEAKERVLDDVISIEDPEFDAHIRGSLASAMRFRSVFIKRKSASELRRLLKDNFHRLGESGLYLLTQTYILARSSLVGQLYDSQGIPHDNAEVTEDLESIAPLNPDQMKEVIQQLSEDHPLEDVWLCFAIISRSGFSEWRDGAGKIAGNLETKLRSESRSEKEEGPKKTVQTQKGDQPPGKPPLEELPEELIAPTFSSLDELLISTMVSTMNEVEGAICPDKLDDLIQEVVDLNDHRTQSQFHLGFVDALLKRESSPRKPGMNDERRSWYLTGLILGKMRHDGEKMIYEITQALEKQDRELLLDSQQKGPRMLAPFAVRYSLANSDIQTARKWVSSHGRSTAIGLLTPIVDSCARFLREEKHRHEVASLLELTESTLYDLRRYENPPPQDLIAELRTLRAIALRMDGKHSESIALLDDLLESPDTLKDAVLCKLKAHKALAMMGLRSLRQFGAEELGSKRVARLEAIEKCRELLEEATQGEQPSIIALYALSLKDVLSGENPVDPNASIDRLQTAIALMSNDGDPLWVECGILERARFYLTYLELQTLDKRVAVSSTSQLLEALDRGPSFPDDLVMASVNNAALLGTPGVEDLAQWVLKRYGHRALNGLELGELSFKSVPFRKALIKTLDDSRKTLNAREQWRGWYSVLRGSLDADNRDLGDAELAIDHLERLSETQGCEEEFLEFLESDSNWDPVWNKEERDVAFLKTLMLLGRNDEAVGLLHIMAHRVLHAGDPDSAESYAEEMKRCGADDTALGSLILGIEHSRQESEEEEPDENPLKIVWIGGNEIQKQYQKGMQDYLDKTHPSVTVDFIYTGWESNWGKYYDSVKSGIDSTDVLVISQYSRTNLGRKLRTLAGTHKVPWRPCTGKGYDAMRRALEAGIKAGRREGCGR